MRIEKNGVKQCLLDVSFYEVGQGWEQSRPKGTLQKQHRVKHTAKGKKTAQMCKKVFRNLKKTQQKTVNKEIPEYQNPAHGRKYFIEAV